jgi:Raf kinase inhibitor-like YbhB/YbcL family protein
MRIRAVAFSVFCACLIAASCGDPETDHSILVAPSAPATRIVTVAGNLSFGSVAVGQSASQTLHITNRGTADLAWTGVNSSDRAFSASPAAGTIPAGGNRAITVTFAPTRAAAYSATITVVSDATSGENTIAASGEASGEAPGEPGPPPLPPSTPFSVSSSSFSNGATIPVRFALCGTGAGNVSPALSWTNVPSGAQTFAIVVDDPTANNFTHWVLFNIPVSVTSVSEGSSVGTAGKNDFPQGYQGARAYGYDGPCPPSGSHTYNFTVYALSTSAISVAPGESRATVQNAFTPFVISSARISGVYQ